MPVVIYPPNLPLHEQRLFHRRDLEEMWASPIPFIPFIIFTGIVFLAGLWGVTHALEWEIFANWDKRNAMLVVSLVPPILLVIAILTYPHFSSPAMPYQLALFSDDDDQQLHWNLAVVSTAHIYCGKVAQYEWINLFPTLSAEDRLQGLGFIKRVRSRLQQIPVLRPVDWVVALIICIVTLVVSLLFLGADTLEAGFHGLAMFIVVQLFMLYLYTQRWQHIRRLMELEEIFEELMPARQPIAAAAPEPDEVTEWAKEQEERWVPPSARTLPSQSDAPPVPWE